MVTRVVEVRSVPAAMLVPSLRPLLPQNAHLAYVPCTNKLVLVDRQANVTRIQKIIAALGSGATAYKIPPCEPLSNKRE